MGIGVYGYKSNLERCCFEKDNCKRTHQENAGLYLDGVKYPLEELYYELYSYFSKIDSDLLSNKRRCISSAYNDARFCSDAFKCRGYEKNTRLYIG
ncbi:MAG: hypothetical protein K2N80_07480 [Lachnospiraceae bacterium]|nr:hypothetical protein [Lachnospiraceae bacterium]